MKRDRNCGVEVFRCLMMFLIVVTHSHCHGIWSEERAWWTVLFALLTWHVDGFLAISGWFGIRFSWRNVAKLWGTIAFYSLLSIAYGLAFHPDGFGPKSIKISGGWFGNTYLFLMFLAPFLNGGVELLARQGKRALLSAWAGLALVFTLQWTPIGVKIGVCHCGEAVYSLMTFAFVYLTARVMRELDLKLTAGKTLGLAFGIYGLGMLIPLFGYLSGWDLISRMHNYRAPHVWMMACGMLYWFVNYVRIPQWLGRICMFIAPSMFGVYLCHDVTSYGSSLYTLPEMQLARMGAHPLVAIIAGAICCFAFCVLVDIVRRGILMAIVRVYKGVRP